MQVLNFTALGDAVNIAARLASVAADGEPRSVSVKGKEEAILVAGSLSGRCILAQDDHA
jgi:class 3 adenylate cyclase